MPRENFKVSISVNVEVDLKDVTLSTANEKKDKLTRIISSCIGERSEFDSARKRIDAYMRSEHEHR